MSSGIDWRWGQPLPDERPHTLPALIAKAALVTDAPVLVEGGRQARWQDLLRGSALVAAAWRDEVHPGDRIVTLMPNGIDLLTVFLACWRLGAIPAPLALNLPDASIATLCDRLAPQKILDGRKASVTLPLASDTADDQGWYPAQGEHTALILQTSGSTGIPKSVELSHENICSQQAAFALLWPDIGPQDTLVSYLPWHHSFGACAETLWGLCRGLTNVLDPGRGHDADGLLQIISETKPTILMSVPKVHRLMAESGILQDLDLKWVFNAGAALPADVEHLYREQGVTVYEGWGLTESSPSAAITPPDVPRTPGVVGQPIPGVGVGIDAEGRVLIAGPGVMQGYVGDPAATARVLQDGILDSGDLGCWSDQGLVLTGRADAIVKHPNGEKVPLPELEARLQAIPGIVHGVVKVLKRTVAIVALDPSISTETIRVALLAHNESEQRAWCKLSAVYVCPSVPSTSNGLLTASHKIDRRAMIRLISEGDLPDLLLGTN